MARKTDPTVAWVMVIILIVIPFLLSAIVTFGTYCWLIALIVGQRYLAAHLPTRPAQANAAELVSSKEQSALDAGLRHLEELFPLRERVFAKALALGLTTRTNEPTRFDERWSHAKQVNAKLASLEEEYRRQHVGIQELRIKVLERRDRWATEFRTWRTLTSADTGLALATRSYFATAGVLLVIALILNPAWVQGVANSGYVWFTVPALSRIYGPLVVAFVVSLLLGLGRWFMTYRGIDDSLLGAKEFEERWARHEGSRSAHEFEQAYWTSSQTSDDEEDAELADGDRDSDEGERREQTCYEILGVNAHATAEEINRAYREQIRQYHPDRVAALGPKLMEVAERESKLLNVARKEALARFTG